MKGISDNDIIEGLRNRDPLITRDYFYGYCRIAYYVYNRQYGLEMKQGLDFYSIAHEYYLSLDRHDFRPLEDRKSGVSLKTWMVNGFRFVLLDRLKSYTKERKVEPFEIRVDQDNLSFDVPDDNFTSDFHNTVFEICHKILGRDFRSSLILQMILIDGFKGKEVAKELGITPSAVTQNYHKLMETVVIPYFRKYYEASAAYESAEMAAPSAVCDQSSPSMFVNDTQRMIPQNRITPNNITSLKPNEIFVFGSNLAGMHGGGAARAAHLYFGAVLGQGVGMQGQSYAIPTMQGGVDTIRPYVLQFIDYAVNHPQQTFLVTPIGCGIAGFTPEEIAPLFRFAVDVNNIYLPESFWEVLV